MDAILAGLRSSEVLGISELGLCLGALKTCLLEAEVREQCVHQFLDLVLDRVRRMPAMTGQQLATELRALLEDTSGLGQMAGVHARWSDDMPGSDVVLSAAAARWDIKELDNRLVGANRASLGRLRSAMGLCNERPLRSAMGLRRRFQACTTMQMSDRHDANINSEQVNRLIRYLGWGDSDSDPRGGRHAILG
ncbi:MAG: hypothetical protein L3K26_14630 [Candidatus Hydrogenedentes bacterium]|nr:hypothetical protein [Candidatus Hydrogenedentota bacterium]